MRSKGRKDMGNGRRGYLQWDDVPDDEAVVYGDGEEARVRGEAAWARLLVRLRELHPFSLSPEADLWVPGNHLSLAGGLVLRRGGISIFEDSCLGFEFLVRAEM